MSTVYMAFVCPQCTVHVHVCPQYTWYVSVHSVHGMFMSVHSALISFWLSCVFLSNAEVLEPFMCLNLVLEH